MRLDGVDDDTAVFVAPAVEAFKGAHSYLTSIHVVREATFNDPTLTPEAARTHLENQGALVLRDDKGYGDRSREGQGQNRCHPYRQTHHTQRSSYQAQRICRRLQKARLNHERHIDSWISKTIRIAMQSCLKRLLFIVCLLSWRTD
ncbi:hypothetical protein [Ruegeria sp. ANG-R]|uniref:hypothetical protein n=1 Tax=Ruegeria sp. ANG-R TaxID=1577903 RepID=UPI00187CD1D2|nr:hypothetical protein [Ruegeria sp. ANG-R]